MSGKGKEHAGTFREHAGTFRSVVSEAAKRQAQLVCDFLADVGTVCFSLLWSDTRRLALEKPPFFLQLELFPARQSSELPSCHAEHRHKVLLREVILRENKTCSEREGRAGVSASR